MHHLSLRAEAAKEELRERLTRLRGDSFRPPSASIVIPVNAQADISAILKILSDLAVYQGNHHFDITLVINNYSLDRIPTEITEFELLGVDVIAIPKVEHTGGVAIAARIPGVRAAKSENIILFDADCRIQNPTALLDWYVAQFEAGVHLAYTHVDYYNLPTGFSVKVRMWIHHASRWIRRTVFGIPTSRGSNYAMQRPLMLDLYEKGRIPYDFHVGLETKKNGGRISYNGSKDLVVYTSGRFFSGGWKELVEYLVWRIGYYWRMLHLKQEPRTFNGTDGE